MDESTKHEILLQLVRLSNADLLSVIEVKKQVQSFTAADLSGEIQVAQDLYVLRMGLS
jgi:hypothetical protein